MLTKIKVFYEQLCRFFYYGWKMKDAYEYDYNSVEQAQYFSLLRLKKFMDSDKTHLMWNDSKDTKLMKRLAETVELSKYLVNHDRSFKNYRKLRKKYKSNKKRGRFDIFEDTFMEYKNAKPIDDKLFRFMMKKAFERDGKEYKAKKKRFEHLMSTYLQHWWD